MPKLLWLPAIALFVSSGLAAQSSNTAASGTLHAPNISYADYQPSAEIKFDLQHTKLEVAFDYTKSRMPGKAWLTLQPHFYPQNKLVLDAKGMWIDTVALANGTKLTPLSFDYSDSLHLQITLPKTYQRGEKFTIYVVYTARPNEIKVKGSAAISDAKGLYFINPNGKDSTKPIQIWTQGETEATSVWCPTIDRPNQKTTSEIAMRVPDKYVTLSNGQLVKQQKHSDNTRTDTWKMDLPHAPYLFFMGVGDYAIVKDKYKNKPVDYYVRKEYAGVAQGIFGNTPEMMAFFSNLLGLDYPWVKYAQIVGEDYVSGAMENTTATLHGSAAYQNARELKDENKWEIVVAHELFHQWFGDLVTAESWSQLTVNESFADYSEYLWLEHKYGKDHALWYNREAMRGYFANPANSAKHLVRFRYADKEEMFDGVSYQKGGRILNMLRHYLGDSAFFKGMALYLSQNKFKTGEAHQVRLAMEEVSGRDLNWFFDQWYFANAHPKVNIRYLHHPDKKNIEVVIEQQQKEKWYSFPLEVDVYTDGKSNRLTQWIKSATDTIRIAYETTPQWINVDPAKLLLWEKTNEQSEAHWLAQAALGQNYIDKAEALEYLTQHWKDTITYQAAVSRLLADEYFGIRKEVLNQLRRGHIKLTNEQRSIVASLAVSDPHPPARAYALDVLSLNNNGKYDPLFEKSLTDSSYSVAGAALQALSRTSPNAAMAAAKKMEGDAKGRLKKSMAIAGYLTKTPDDAAEMLAAYKRLQVFEKIMETNAYLHYAHRLTNLPDFRKAVGSAIEAYKMLKFDYQGLQTDIASTLHWMMLEREKMIALDAENTMARDQLKYLREKTGW